MRDHPQVSDIRFAPARPELRAKGMLGYACCVLDGSYRLDGLSVRVTTDGAVKVSFPSRTDDRGVMHPIYKPLTNAAREAIETPVVAELRRRRLVPSIATGRLSAMPPARAVPESEGE